MTTNKDDSISAIFDQAIKDGRRDDVCDHWFDLVLLDISLFHAIRQIPSIDVLIDQAMQAMQDRPTVADLTPREYERLCKAVDGLRLAVDEFGDAWQAVERNMARPIAAADSGANP